MSFRTRTSSSALTVSVGMTGGLISSNGSRGENTSRLAIAGTSGGSDGRTDAAAVALDSTPVAPVVDVPATEPPGTATVPGSEANTPSARTMTARMMPRMTATPKPMSSARPSVVERKPFPLSGLGTAGPGPPSGSTGETPVTYMSSDTGTALLLRCLLCRSGGGRGACGRCRRARRDLAVASDHVRLERECHVEHVRRLGSDDGRRLGTPTGCGGASGDRHVRDAEQAGRLVEPAHEVEQIGPRGVG